MHGIYQILNKITGKYYIGSAIDVDRRWREHQSHLRCNCHDNEHLQRSYNKYGPDAFAFSVLEEVGDSSQLIAREQHWIDSLDATEAGYNICKIAGSTLGQRHDIETRRKISERKRNPSEETRRRLSAAKKGKQVGQDNPFFGKKHTEESLKRNSEAHRKPMSEDTKRKISDALKGRPKSDDTKKRMSEAQKGNTNSVGCTRSDETRRRMSIAQQKRRGAEKSGSFKNIEQQS